jgi:hypothetical protein
MTDGVDMQRVIGGIEARTSILETRFALTETRIDQRLGAIEVMLRSLQGEKDRRECESFERKRIAGAVAILIGASAGAGELVWHVWRWVTGK